MQIPIERTLQKLGIEQLNAMQLETASIFHSSDDIVLLSPTGSGKTLAFLLPLLENLSDSPHIQALVIVPSRELALQIETVFKSLQTGLKVSCCYGGHAISVEKNNLLQAPALLIGTPGRVDDLLKRQLLNLSQAHVLVLDEFDKSLELGFKEEMAYIIKKLSSLKKRVLTSATTLHEIPDFLGIKNKTTLDFLLPNTPNPKLQLRWVTTDTSKTNSNDKLVPLLQLLATLGAKSTMVFFNHRESVTRASVFLAQEGVVHAVFHGELKQDERERSLAKFRNGSVHILLATDLAARGIDIPDVDAVVHYHLPTTADAFIHRNGRTARMHAEGTVYILETKSDKIPKFIAHSQIENELIAATNKKPAEPLWETLYIGKGKKDKINKNDIVGFLLQKGKLEKDALGIIEVKDFHAYAAIKRAEITKVLKLIGNEKLKNQKVKFEVAK